MSLGNTSSELSPPLSTWLHTRGRVCQLNRPRLSPAVRGQQIRPESQLTNLPGHLWRDKWTALSGPLPCSLVRGAGVLLALPGADVEGVLGRGLVLAQRVGQPHDGWPQPGAPLPSPVLSFSRSVCDEVS